MKVMLDTDVCVSLIRQKDRKRISWALGHRPGELGISLVTLCELEYGVANSSDPARNAAALLQFLAPVEIADLDARVAAAYGTIRCALKHAPIGPMDTLLAAHAVALRVAFATDNVREFSRVPGLKMAVLP